MKMILFSLAMVSSFIFISCSSDSPGTIAGPGVANLATISPDNGTLTPAFDPDVTTYTLQLKNRISSVDLGLDTSNSSLITVNGIAPASSYDLSVGDSVFTIDVTAPNGSESLQYTVTVTRARQFVYVTNVVDAGPDSPLHLYSINPSNGQLEPLSPATATVEDDPYDLLVSPDGEKLYVANALSNTISQFALDPMTGALTPLSPATVAQSPTPYAMVMTSNSRYLFGMNGDTFSPGLIAQYTVATNGALSANAVATVNSGSQPWFPAITPDDRFVYVTNFSSGAGSANDTIQQYAVNMATGRLTALSPSTVATQDKPWHINVDPSGKHVYVTNFGSNTVGAYSINATTGQLTLINNYAVGNSPVGLTIDPQGRFVYVANSTSNTVSQFRRNTSTGALTAIGGGTIAVASAPYGLEVDHEGEYLYVAQSGTNTIAQFSINQTTGALTALSPATVSAGTNPRFIRISR